MSWIVVLTFSNARLSYQLTLATVVAVLVLCSVIILSIAFVAVVMHFCISVPLSALSSRMNAVATLNITPSSSVSSFYEFNGINRALTSMNHGLSNFAKFVPIKLVSQLLAANKAVELGVHQQHMTVMFIDVKNFTLIAEQSGTKVLVELLQGFFEAAFTSIEQHNGIVDKYIGDCVMAYVS